MKLGKIIVSACLVGDKVKYDGSDNYYENPILSKWIDEDRVVKICPEVIAGLSIPRPPAEIVGGNGGAGVLKNTARVLTKQGLDITGLFLLGAEKALGMALQENIKIAVLKSRSPSCGSNKIYDGTFSGKLIKGDGVTVSLLRAKGLEVYSEDEIDLANERLKAMEGL